MPADEIIESGVKAIFRVMGRFIVEILWEIVCYYVGFPLVRLFTLGKYPEDKPTDTQQAITATIGFLVLFLVGLWLSGHWD